LRRHLNSYGTKRFPIPLCYVYIGIPNIERRESYRVFLLPIPIIMSKIENAVHEKKVSKMSDTIETSFLHEARRSRY